MVSRGNLSPTSRGGAPPHAPPCSWPLLERGPGSPRFTTIWIDTASTYAITNYYQLFNRYIRSAGPSKANGITGTVQYAMGIMSYGRPPVFYSSIVMHAAVLEHNIMRWPLELSNSETRECGQSKTQNSKLRTQDSEVRKSRCIVPGF